MCQKTLDKLRLELCWEDQLCYPAFRQNNGCGQIQNFKPGLEPAVDAASPETSFKAFPLYLGTIEN